MLIRNTFRVLFLTIAFVPSILRGDFVLVIGNGDGVNTPTVTATQGQTGVRLPVFGYFSSQPGTSNGLGAYNIALDIGANQGAVGFGLPTGFSAAQFSANGGIPPNATPLNGAVGLNNTAAGALDVSFPGQVNFDFLANGSSTPDYQLGTSFASRTKLFDLIFDVGNNAAAGIYSVDAVLSTASGLIPNLVNVAPSSIGALSSLNGSFQITAVPEPASFMTTTILALSGAFYRRRRI